MPSCVLTSLRLFRLAAFALATSTALAAGPAEDPMLPRSDPASARVSPLRVITITTGDLETTRRFYQGALAMTPAATELTGQAAVALREHWGLPPGQSLRMMTFTRSGLGDAIVVRAIEVPATTAVMRPDYNSEFLGALGLGFPSNDLAVRDEIVRAMGFSSVVGITRMAFPRADQTTYEVGEVHYRAPDNVLVLGVDRGEMQPVSSIDAALGLGGPAYASMIISDAARVTKAFADVLGYEMRREMTFASAGPDGGMGLQKGARVRFQQWFSPGSRAGYLVIMDLLDAERSPPVALGPRNRGIAMWSFETPDLEGALARAREAGLAVLSDVRTLDVPTLGRLRSFVFETADGFPIEVYQSTAAGQPTAGALSCEKPVYMVVAGVTLDPKRMREYAVALAKSGLYPGLGGYYLNSPRPIAVFEGTPDNNFATLIVRFPCLENAEAFWNSRAYQETVVPLRVNPSAGDYTVTVYSEADLPEYMRGKVGERAYVDAAGWTELPAQRTAGPSAAEASRP